MNNYEKVSYHIAGVWNVINSLFAGLWDFMDKGVIIRRIAFFAMLYLTYESFSFCFKAAEAAKWDAATIGALFGILTPVSVLQAAVFKFYGDSRHVYKAPNVQAIKDDQPKEG